LKPKLVIVFSIIIFVPMMTIAWLGLRISNSQSKMVELSFKELIDERLSDVQSEVSKLIAKRRNKLLKIAKSLPGETSKIRDSIGDERIIRQIFVLDENGKLTHPPLLGQKNKEEEEFLKRTNHIWKTGEVFISANEPGRESKENSSDSSMKFEKGNSKRPISKTETGDYGWYTWYVDGGLNILFWLRDHKKQVVGLELDRISLLSDIVGELPDTESNTSTSLGSMQIVDASGKSVYVWGAFSPLEDAKPTMTKALHHPLGAWRLQYFANPKTSQSRVHSGIMWGTITSILAMVLALGALAVYFFRETGKEAKSAAQRVNFVNQVSHELKTPLTNIRMYAELLSYEIDEEDEKQGRYLNIIVFESQRLSRLIGNVLSFARGQRKKLVFRPTEAKLDDIITQVLDQFKPSLDSLKFEIETNLNAGEISRIDCDATRQILGNLLSNVEKYAASGKWLRIESYRDGEFLYIKVSDRGVGIPNQAKNRVFKPFERLSRKVTDGVAGTGIGLSISRELAVLHGGNVHLKSFKQGCEFEVSLHAPSLEAGDEK